MKCRYVHKWVLKVFVFLLIGILLFGTLQEIFIMKHFPYEKSYDAGKLRYYMGERNSAIDVLICGTSHPARGILPMEMYELYGIKAYNLATSVQPIEATYYILKEAVKRQTPKVVIWDVSNLHFDNVDSVQWKRAINEMPAGKNKAQLVKEYLDIYSDTGESLIDFILPLLEYHTRWKELEKKDFNVAKRNKRYFSKGGEIFSTVGGGISADDMNVAADTLLQNTVQDLYAYTGQEFNELHEENIFYAVDAESLRTEWFLKIKDLCAANNIQLLAVKVPSVYMPHHYASAWVEEKYNITRELCEEYGVAYYDLLYDTNLNLDFGKDSEDRGPHLNLYGARKVSADLGSYLKKNYELSDGRNEQWDNDLKSYQKVRRVALLELEQDFSAYINMLADGYQDYTIFIAASDDMSQGLDEMDINALRSLGLQTDFSIALQHSYIAVIENGEVKYEALSNRPLNYSGECNKSRKNYELYSSGWWTVAGASIKLGGSEYAVNSRGLNIVVYDDERGLVLDSVGFDTCVEYHEPVRNNEMIKQMEETFEYYIMEVEDR